MNRRKQESGSTERSGPARPGAGPDGPGPGTTPGVAPGKLGIWLHALRAPFLTASGLPVLLGAFAAYAKTGYLSPLRLGLTLGGVLCVHLGANLANDYFDHVTGCDRQNPEPTPFSGGSRVIQDGLVPARSILAASIAFFLLGLAQGLALNQMVPGNRVIFLGIAGILLGLLYTAVPVKLSYRGIGELAVFAAFGPLTVAGAYLCQTGGIGAFPLLVSVPAGLLVLAILLINEVLDVVWDERADKRTMVVALGRRRGYRLFMLVYIAAYGWIGFGIVRGWYSPWAAVAIAPLVLFAGKLMPAPALRDRPGTIEASRVTILSHTLTTGLLALSFLL